MKTIKYYIMMAVMLLTAACSGDDDYSDDLQNGTDRMVRITVDTPQTTRISYDDDAVQPFAWEAGDKLLVAEYDKNDSFVRSTEFVMENITDGTATFKGIVDVTTANVKMYYAARNLSLTADGNAVIDYSTQTQDLNNPSAHIKDFMFLASDMITSQTLIDDTSKTLNLQNSMLRLDVKSFPEAVGALRNVTLCTNAMDIVPQSSSIALTNVTTSPFKVFMMFDPATNAQQAGGSFMVLFKGDKTYRVTKDNMPASSFDKGGTRYNLTVYQNEQDVVKGLNNWVEFSNVFIEKETNIIKTFEPGAITHDIIVDAAGSTTNLRVEGRINGKDIKAIREATGCSGTAIITTLDMADAMIVASDDVYCIDGNKQECKTTDNCIGDNMFASTKLTKIVMPKNITSIGKRAFFNSQLTSVSIPAEVTTLGDEAFLNSKNLGNVVFEGNKVQELSYGSFKSCRGFKTFNIPSSVKTLRGQCLTSTAMEYIVIPETVKMIEKFTFQGPKFKTITIKCASTANISDDFFMRMDAPSPDLILDSSWQDASVCPKGNNWKNYDWKSITFHDYNKPTEGDDAGSSLGGINDNGNIANDHTK